MTGQDMALRRREAIWRWVERLYGWPPAAWEPRPESGEENDEPFAGEGAVFRMRHPLYKIELHVFRTPVWGDYVARVVQFASDRGFPVSPYLPGLDGSRLVRWKDRVLAACRSWEGPSPPPVGGTIRQLFAHAAWWHRVALGPTPAWPRCVDPLPERLEQNWMAFIEGAPEDHRAMLEGLFAAWHSWASKWDLPRRWSLDTAAGGAVGAFDRVDDWVDGGEGAWWLRRANRCRPGAPFEDIAGLLLRYGGRAVDPKRWESWIHAYREVTPFPDDRKFGIALILWSPQRRPDEEWFETAARWTRRAQELAGRADWFGVNERRRREWRDIADRLVHSFGPHPAVSKTLPDADVVNASGSISRRRAPAVRLALQSASGYRVAGTGRKTKKTRTGRDPWLSDADPCLSPAGEHRDENYEQHHENEHV
ncbi:MULTISPECIES: hypothetical protein [Kyrpidia]|uniref:Uncharacterized protein n=2 Tax=Kyrpidia spormannii TaxID=2055160 RepID=A0ACA8Z8X1_9BACL|nr:MULTISPECIES: hypothetical protein [Kyrpidia]MCL6575613.1 hypothetical protein [Kyrpidia sp.]CAB3390981.1 conserved protein of unknown function [Kyrpidia spormannii]CAB3391889.1 conserved protein of unknown function [Kyrpidia spormannii]